MTNNNKNTIKKSQDWALVLLTAFSVCAAGGAVAKDSLSDEAISNAVGDQFVFDSAVPYNDIDIETKNGVVVLSGTVSNLLAKSRATEIAEAVRGVRSVVNRIEVDPWIEKTAKEVRQNVSNALLLDPATDSYEIRIEADESGKVTLNGIVDSWQEKQLCEKVASSTGGVTEVDNNITVNYKDDRIDDEIKPEIERRLMWDVLVDHSLINVEVHDGNVKLSGEVGSAAEKRRASWDSWVAGVESVDASRLKVARWVRDEELRADKYADKSDEEIQKAIKDALLYDPRILSFNVTPDVSQGVVTLTGLVDNAKARKAAERDARNTVGVIDVHNRIKVRPDSEITDMAIAENVRLALLVDPVVERYQLTVRVMGGVAHLYGTVDTYFEKLQAEDVASRTTGVVDVRNHIDVEFPESFIQNPYVYPYWSLSYPLSTRIYSDDYKSDEQIMTDIEDELWWSPFVDEESVDVAVENRIAVLSGEVDTWGEYYTARNCALEAGAAQVVNKLEVK